jgi:hypothetical protein
LLIRQGVGGARDATPHSPAGGIGNIGLNRVLR